MSLWTKGHTKYIGSIPTSHPQDLTFARIHHLLSRYLSKALVIHQACSTKKLNHPLLTYRNKFFFTVQHFRVIFCFVQCRTFNHRPRKSNTSSLSGLREFNCELKSTGCKCCQKLITYTASWSDINQPSKGRTSSTLKVRCHSIYEASLAEVR